MDRYSRRGRGASGLGAAALVVVALGAGGCGRRATDEEIVSPQVPTIDARTATAVRRELVERLVVRGSVVARPNEDVRITAQVAGRIVAMEVAEGDAVRAGQLLAQIETRPLEEQRRAAAAALAQAQAERDNAERNLGRAERLFERGIAAGKEVEEARAQRATAAAAVEKASADLSAAARQIVRARVTSPIRGQVVRRFVGVGEQVDGTVAQPLVEVANLEQVELSAQVPSEHLARVRVGQAAEVTSDATGGRVLAGRVTAIAPAVDPVTNAVLVRIAVGNRERLLKVGTFAEARIALATKPTALAVPRSALSQGDQGVAVYVVTGDLAVRTPVQLGLETSDAVEILSGVSEGQLVLVSSVHGLGEKARLAARP